MSRVIQNLFRVSVIWGVSVIQNWLSDFQLIQSDLDLTEINSELVSSFIIDSKWSKNCSEWVTVIWGVSLIQSDSELIQSDSELVQSDSELIK